MPRQKTAAKKAAPKKRAASSGALSQPSPVGDVPSRRQELLDIAVEIFAENGYRGTTVRDIADRAGMLSGSLFYHFKTKHSIAEELIQPVFEKLVVGTREVMKNGAAPDKQIAELIRAYIVVSAGENRLTMRMLQNDWNYFVNAFSFLSEGFVEINRLWMKLLKQGVAEGLLRNDLDPAILIHLVRSVSNDITRWYNPKGPYSIDEIADAAVTVVLSGIQMPAKGKASRP